MKPKVSLFILLFSLMMAFVFFSLHAGYERKPRVARINLILGIVSSSAALAAGAMYVMGKIRERKKNGNSRGGPGSRES